MPFLFAEKRLNSQHVQTFYCMTSEFDFLTTKLIYVIYVIPFNHINSTLLS